MLNDFLDRWQTSKAAKLVESTNGLIAAFRRHELPVIWVRQEFRPDLSDAFLEMRDKQIAVTIEGTRGAQLHEGLDWRLHDPTIVKKRYSAFFGTDLEAVLAKLGVSHLVLSGVNTHACIRMTAIDAYQRDYRVILARDCISSHDEEHARISLKYMDGKIGQVMPNAELAKTLMNA